MERLTRKDKCKLSHGEDIVICNHDKQDCNDSCMSIKPCKWYKKVQDKLWEYENLEEQGLLLRLPCKVGDTVYILRKNIVNEEQVYDVQYRGITYQKGQRWYVNIGGLAYFEMDFGKYVFLTQSEAEQKLKEMESD